MEPRIFISYRRKPNSPHARLLKDRLSQIYGENVFFDVSNLKGGTKFREEIIEEIKTCDFFILLIGPSTFSERINNQDDWIRMEIKLALDCNRRIIPVKVDGFPIPNIGDLPFDIQDLLFLNATDWYTEGSTNQFDAGIKDITDVIDSAFDNNLVAQNTDNPYEYLIDFFKPIPEKIAFQRQYLIGRAGYKNSEGEWDVNLKQANGHGVHGPYVLLFEGTYRVTFRLKIDDNTPLDGNTIAAIDVTHEVGEKNIVGPIRIKAENFPSSNQYIDFVMTFEIREKRENVEFRFATAPNNNIDRTITLHSVRLEKLS